MARSGVASQCTMRVDPDSPAKRSMFDFRGMLTGGETGIGRAKFESFARANGTVIIAGYLEDNGQDVVSTLWDRKVEGPNGRHCNPGGRLADLELHKPAPPDPICPCSREWKSWGTFAASVVLTTNASWKSDPSVMEIGSSELRVYSWTPRRALEL